MRILITVLMLVLLSGCATLRKGEIRDIECRVLGIDASIPIPFAKGVNIMNIRMGWVETRYIHGYDSMYKSNVTQKMSHLGEVHRVTEMSPKK